jgi:glycosyltransferase involved in cell wall biosynthesis
VTAVDVVLPCLDEVAALPWVLGRMPAGYRPIVVDNGSRDGSGELAASLGATVIREDVPGFGSACFTGLSAASADVVCFCDCDGSIDPLDLPTVAGPVLAGTADLVLAARVPVRGAWPMHARFANRELARRVRRATGVPLTDLGPLRAACRVPLLDLDITDRRSGWPLEMVLKAARAGWRIEETRVSYLPRSGRSKVTGTVRGTVGAIRDMNAALAEHRLAG